MDYQSEKEVYFDKYCPTCKHAKAKGTDAPCCDCLCEPTNTNTHRPVNYEVKETKR